MSRLEWGTVLKSFLVDLEVAQRYRFGMPRYARVHVTGGLFHVISRFHDRRFYLDLDGAREKYLEFLGKAAEAHDARIIAYCMMSFPTYTWSFSLATMPSGC
jgi:hypothetical protein